MITQKQICERKLRFTSKAQADKMINRAWSTSKWDTGKGLRPIASYRCPICHKWHMTSKPQTGKR